jgi:endonuclease YncB( thermonuclease family)
MKFDFTYQAVVKSVYDGDTIIVDVDLSSLLELRTLSNSLERIDLGFSVDIPLDWAKLLARGQEKIWLRNQRIRFYGINCPELRTSAGLKAMVYVRSLLPVGSTVLVQTFRVSDRTKQEKYGRYLGVIFLEDMNLNQHLINKGYAVPFMVE